jgi:uncharacterized membrane protein
MYTLQAVNAAARSAWVETIMTGANKDILAVQTLRNAIMGPTFLASTAVLLMVGTLTLSGQSESLVNQWDVLNFAGSKEHIIWMIKLICLLLDLVIALFSFMMSIRLFVHVGFMINVPLSLKHKKISPKHVAMHLNRAGRFHSIGMRAYYFAVPLVFWLFGPHLMLMATTILIAVLYRLDRVPEILSEDYK